MKPHTQYTKSSCINIAYQVFGSGTIDLVYIPGWVSNIDWMWACPELVNFLTELGKMARVILFDKRGTGLSDRITELSTLEERMDDIRAVMDAVGSQKAILFGHSEGGSVSALFAATYPNRTISLITFGIFAKRKYSPSYPWAPTDEERQVVYDMIENSWGSGDMKLESLAPSKAHDKTFMDWLANYFRSGASPSAALALTKMNTEVDIIHILESIKVPTLILQRTKDIDVKIEEGKFIAQRIPGAKFVELEGDDHLFWVGDTKEVLNQISEFILKKKPNKTHKQQLLTLGSAKIISGQKMNSYQVAFFTKYIEQYRGKFIQGDGQSFIATFEGPSKAVNCGLALVNSAVILGAQIVIAIHIKEISIKDSHIITEDTYKFMDSVLEHGKPNQILITHTVKHLLSGTGLSFNQYASLLDTYTGAYHSLFTVIDKFETDIAPNWEQAIELPKYDSLLQAVLQCIEKHLRDDFFGVDLLCKEMAISERQLQRKLKAITNKSPIKLITSVRLHRAKELIMEGNKNISQIAYETGFSNPSYFSKSFKKEFGTTPSDLPSKNRY
jgi:pimeloyl-ACP methyl ester carboxylesterase/AraC-like DNA-binding protein